MRMKYFFSFLFSLINIAVLAQELIEFTEMPENLGSNVNSIYNDLNPTISPDGKTLFISRYMPDNNGASNIWVSYLQNDGKWGMATNIGTPLNVKGSSTSVQSITPDGNTIVLSNLYKYFDGSITGGGCSVSSRQRGGWAFPKQQIIDKYENNNQYVNFYLSNSGKFLLMAIEKKKGFGEKDLYVSYKTGDNNWSIPKNLGNVVNTKEAEFSPFLAADDKTLFYASRGLPGGFGDADIWMTKRLDDTWTNWSKPINLGSKINSAGFDAYFSIDAAGEYAYFSSSQNTYGLSDIFRIKMPSEAKPEPVVLVYGKVIDQKTNQPIKASIRYEKLPSGIEVGVANTHPENMVYKIVLPAGENYGFMATANEFYSVTQNIDLSNLKSYYEMEVNLYLAPIIKNEAIRLNNIFFESGKSVLKEESYPELLRLIKLLELNASISIEIHGHTDDVGKDDDNLLLSQARAEAVVEYLKEKKINSSRLLAKGFGESKPIAENTSEVGKQLNRRVEFIIVK